MTSLSTLPAESITVTDENPLLTLEQWLDKATIPIEDREMYVKIVDDKVSFVATFDESCSMSDLFSFASSNVSSIQKLENCDKLKEVSKEVHDRVMATLSWLNLFAKAMCEIKLLEINAQINARKDELLNTLKQQKEANKEEEVKKEASEEVQKKNDESQSPIAAGGVPDVQSATEDLPKKCADSTPASSEPSETVEVKD